MFSFFKPERNEPCECGSGKKYKRCCKDRVDELFFRWRRRWEHLTPGFVQALALACGLAPGRDGAPPPPETIDRAGDKLNEMWGLNDEEAIIDRIGDLLASFSRVLLASPLLADQLFPLHRLRNVMDELDAVCEDLDGEALEEAFDRVSQAHLPRLVTEDMAEDMAWTLFDLIRSEDLADDDLPGVLLALQFSIIETADNPLWEMILRVSVGVAAAALDEFPDLIYDKTADIEQTAQYLAKHPIMEREWSRIVRESMQPAIDAIIEGVIPLDIPPYAVAGSLLAIRQYVDAVSPPDRRPPGLTELTEMLGRPAHIEDLWDVIWGQGLDADFDVFIDYIEEQLEGWLDDEGGEAPDELEDAVVSLLENLGQELLSAQCEVTNFFYLRAVEICTSEVLLRLPAVGHVPEYELDWMDQKSLKGYAAYLDNTGQAEGAEHIRDVFEPSRKDATPDAVLKGSAATNGRHHGDAGGTNADDVVYQLKITLKGIRPPIWRRVLVPRNITFLKLHKIIQAAFGWQDYHLFRFDFRDIVVAIPDPDYPAEEFYDTRELNAKRAKIDGLLTERGKCIYTYDFGDNWEHDIVFERILPAEEDKRYPFCTGGARHRPPEDVGGVTGYEKFLSIIRDRQHPEHDDYLAWAEKDTDGRKFDPEYFYLNETNRALAKIKQARQRGSLLQ